MDRLFLQDVRLTAGNHEAYFVFEDLVVQILLCFSRDTQFLEHFKSTSASPPHAYTRNNMGESLRCKILDFRILSADFLHAYFVYINSLFCFISKS